MDLVLWWVCLTTCDLQALFHLLSNSVFFNLVRNLMTTEMRMMLFMSWMAKNCAVKGKKQLLSLFWTLYFELLAVNDGCKRKLAEFTCHYHVQTLKSLVSDKVPKRTSLFSCCLTDNETTAVNVNRRLSGSFQGHDWACSLQTGQRWWPRNGAFWWWWWWRLSALSQQWTQVMRVFLRCGRAGSVVKKKRLNLLFAIPDMDLLFALSTGSLWRTFPHGSAGR